MYIVSACLAGLRTRYDGTDCPAGRIQNLVYEGKAIPVCPEQLGGLPTPREPIVLVNGDGKALIKGSARALGEETGTDYTPMLLRGAEEVLNMISMISISGVFLKDGSPSCGFSYIKAGKDRIKGIGVTAAVLLEAGVKVLY